MSAAGTRPPFWAGVREAVALAGLVAVVTVSATATSWFVADAAARVAGNRMAPWIIGRAAGVTSYLLLVVLVALGLVLSHPWRTRFRRPSTATRLRLHISLAIFTLAFTALHIVVLATDRYAGVGWRGVLLPMGASYRPVPVTLGLLGLYAGLLAGVTAALAGRLTARLWWPVHKVAALALVAVWVHGVRAGSDTPALFVLYVGTAAALVALAVSRYVARTPADRVAELADRTSPGPVEPAASRWVPR